jgi:alpha-1,2-mannosyltransferase
MSNNVRIFLILIVTAILSWMRYHTTPSPDFLATWMAGKYFSEGVFEQIYSSETDIFRMLPPSNWLPYLRSTGYDKAIYPFIYPPLWAWVGAFLHRISSFEALSSVASFLNPLMLGMTIWLTARMTVEKASQLKFTIFTIILFVTSISALVALEQNQPQILVGFLMLLGVERTRAGSPIAGGVVMAIAASLKLYPIFFALMWWAMGEKKAAITFTLAGGAIGLFSIAVAGWPLHVLFLEQVSTISRSVMVTFFTFSIDPTIAKMFISDQLQFVTNLQVVGSGEVDVGWEVFAKPALWRLTDAGLLIGAIVVLYRIARSSRGSDPLFWPLAFTVIALVSPLSWGYHYLPALAFAFALTERFSIRIGIICLLVVFYPISVVFLMYPPPGIAYAVWMQPLGTLAMAFFAGFLWFAIRKRQPK